MIKKAYQFQFSKNAEKNFALLEKSLQKRIVKKLGFFEKCEDPLSFAKPLSGFRDIHSFRIGDYRVIVKPKNEEILIILLILKIAHRREVYLEF